MDTKSLETLGYDTFFHHERSDDTEDGFSLARITEVNRNSFVVADGNHEMMAELSGKLLFHTENSIDYPTVGDWVTVQSMNDYTLAIVHAVLPRKTLLKRKEPGKRIEFQLIAANVDFGLVVQSADHLNLNLLDRYLVMLHEAGITPVIIISKIDLVSPSAIDLLKESLSKVSNQTLFISNKTDRGTDALSNALISGKTYCLLGQSGVGKSSLLNTLLGTNVLEVNNVREKDGRGKHTTVRRQLIRLATGSIFVDTPGIRELGNFEVDRGLNSTFEGFSSYAQNCRFTDCTHTHEEGCAIIAAVENGAIDDGRYRNYCKLKKESEFYDMSYQEKRKKDKSFGKMVKNYKKTVRK